MNRTEAKKKAYILKDFLAEHNIKVKPSLMLEALARMEGEKSWNVLQSKLEDDQPKVLKAKGPAILATLVCDDGRKKAEFDASFWFEGLVNKDRLYEVLTELEDGHYCGIELTQEIAEAAIPGFPQVKEFFEHLNAAQLVWPKPVGYECTIKRDDLVTWLERHHPEIAAWLVISWSDDYAVMEADDLPGMFDWIGPDGRVCDQSYDTEDEAYLAAYADYKDFYVL